MQLILIMLVAPMFAFGWSSYGREPEYTEETHLSDLVTKWPTHMPTSGIKHGLQRWEASALTLRQPDSIVYVYCNSIIIIHDVYVYHFEVAARSTSKYKYQSSLPDTKIAIQICVLNLWKMAQQFDTIPKVEWTCSTIHELEPLEQAVTSFWSVNIAKWKWKHEIC